jgi:hypothetical protein
VPAGKNNLILRSKTPLAAIIKAPAAMVGVPQQTAIVEVAGAQNTTIRQFTITGPSVAIGYGVFVNGGGSANILGNHITHIHDAPALDGNQNGNAVRIGRSIAPGPGSANVIGNQIDNYQKGGIIVDGPGSTGFVSLNNVQGIGATDLIAQNGIQLSRDAVAQIVGNRVQENRYTKPETNSEGILIYGAGVPGSVISNNVVTKNDENIGAYRNQDAPFVPSRGAKILNNTLLDAVRYDGIFLDAFTSDFRVEGNFLRRNAEHDCHDDSHGSGTAGTANFWHNNDGVTSLPSAICRPGRGN